MTFYLKPKLYVPRLRVNYYNNIHRRSTLISWNLPDRNGKCTRPTGPAPIRLSTLTLPGESAIRRNDLRSHKTAAPGDLQRWNLFNDRTSTPDDVLPSIDCRRSVYRLSLYYSLLSLKIIIYLRLTVNLFSIIVGFSRFCGLIRLSPRHKRFTGNNLFSRIWKEKCTVLIMFFFL